MDPDLPDPDVTSTDEERSSFGREWLESYFADEEGWGTEPREALVEWFADLASYVASLPLTDRRLTEAATYLAPFLTDGPALEGYVMYYNGRAVLYLEDEWDGDMDRFLTGFIQALGHDYRSYLAGGFRE